jgi:hypothetical protein
MAAPNTNPTDRATDAALRQVLRAGQGVSTGCDVEAVAAYAEGRLRGAERRRAEEHLAECASCRRVATDLMDELAPEQPVEEPAPARVWWRWQWALPALAGMLIVGSVVLYQRQQGLRPAAPASDFQIAQLEKEASAPPAAQPVPAPEPPAERRNQARPAARAAADRVAPVAPPPAAGGGYRSAEASQVLNRQEAASAQVAGNAGPPPAAPTAAVVGQVREGERDMADQRLRAGTDEEKQKATAMFAKRADEGLAPLPEGAPLRASTREGERIWAVSDGGRIFRSTDGGRTWTRLASPTTADLVLVRWDPQARQIVVVDRQGAEYRVEP